MDPFDASNNDSIILFLKVNNHTYKVFHVLYLEIEKIEIKIIS